MKYTWQPDDIKPGIFVCKHPSYQGEKDFVPSGNSLKWTMLIGFVAGRAREGSNKYVTIAVCDGMVLNQHTKEELAEQFNRDELMPMPYAWLAKVLEYNLKGYYRA